MITLRFAPDGDNQIACDGSVHPATGGAFQAFEIGLPPRPQLGDRLQCRSLAAGAATVNWIVPTAEGAGNGTEVADFAVQFGVDTSPVDTPADFGCGVATAAGRSRDCIADSYVAALPAGVTSNQIKAVRVCLVLRSEASDGSVVKPKGVPKCAEVLAGTADAADAEVISSSQTDRKLYRTFVTTVLMKNLKDN